MSTKAKSAPKGHAAPATLQLGPVTVTTGAQSVQRMAVMLWGAAGCGKTTFAATAPGCKLWLSFGDNEHVTVAHRNDVQVAPLYDLSIDDLFKHGQNDNPFNLDTFLAQNQRIETVVVDSVTALAFRALQKAVAMGVGASRTFTPSIEMPGISAYGARNGIVLATLTGLLRVTAKHNVHIIAIAHEADPVKAQDERGNEVIDYISVMLGGQLVNNMTWRLSEIWYMSQKATGDKSRQLAIRPIRKRKPMKTRMFRSDGAAEFDLTYDPLKADDAKGQMTIARWWDAWIDGGASHIDVPH
jgi:hypothetical protein